jgi:hypothetical protein
MDSMSSDSKWPMTHEEIVQRIEWPLLQCMQEYHFFYVPQRDDIDDYRFGFGRELMLKRGYMHQLWIHGLSLRATVHDKELLFLAPRYRALFNILAMSETGFSSAARFAGALTRRGAPGKPDEEIFALIAVGHEGNAGPALKDFQAANKLFIEAGVPPMECLFLIAAETELPPTGASELPFRDIEGLTREYGAYHHIIEEFRYNKTVWGEFAKGETVETIRSNARRVARRCKTIVIRIPAQQGQGGLPTPT